MRVLVAYERSGVVRRAFAALGHDAWSCDLQPAADGDTRRHEQCDAQELADCGAWDLIIAHPPCTYLSASGLHWNGRVNGRQRKTDESLATIAWWLDLPNQYAARDHQPLRLCIENPVGLIGSRLRKASQYVQPYEFGDDASKRTGLWLIGLPTLVSSPSAFVPGRIVGEDKRGRTIVRWSNQTDSGQNKLGPSADRADKRAETYPGIARAMAEQWSL